MAQCSIIPPGVAAVVQVNGYGTYTMIWKDSHMITIQRQPVPVCWDISPEADKALQKKILAHNDETLEIIQTLLDHSRFGSVNWGYLVSSSRGHHRIVYRNRALPRIVCRTWAPLIDESELDITYWGQPETQFAMWRGRKVEIRMAWNDLSANTVQIETIAREPLAGLDVSFEVLAHVLREGEVVGLVLEPTEGRFVNRGDRALVYEAVAKMQSRGLFFDFFDRYEAHNILITDDEKIRFVTVISIAPFDKDDKGHSERLNTYLNGFEESLRYGEVPCHVGGLLSQADRIQSCVLIPKPPHLGVREILVQLQSRPISPFDDDAFFSFVGVRNPKKKSRKSNSFIAPESDGEASSSAKDTPIGRQATPPWITTDQPHIPNIHHSHRKSLLLPSENSDTAKVLIAPR